jgi:hypothetical protein
MNPIASVLLIAFGITLLIVLGFARLIGKGLQRYRFALLMFTGVCVTIAALVQSGQLPILSSGLTIWDLWGILWKPALINAGVVLGIWFASIAIGDHWHPPQFIEFRGKSIPISWIKNSFIAALAFVAVGVIAIAIFHQIAISIFLMVFGVSLFGKVLHIYKSRDKAQDTYEQREH